jgi:DNA polymerase III subunit epsilon
VDLLEQPVAGAEFLAVDTETNGLAADLCELIEVGAVLVGGGELHETFESLVRVERPLSRGIQRFTGITQAMVDAAPPPEEVFREFQGLLAGRVLLAHSARFDTHVLRMAFERSGLEWSSPPALCTVQLARRFAPLARKHALAPLADSLGIEVVEVHRALPDALTCARVFCALFPRLCANAITVGDALDLLRTRRRARKTEPATSAGGPFTSASPSRSGRVLGLTSARRRAGPSGRRSSTIAPRIPSSAPSCSRTA